LIFFMKAYWRILVVLFLWTAACWLIIGGLLRPVLPGGWLTVLVLASLCVAPSLGMVRNLGRSAYPSALRRLWLVRPFWYAQLFMPPPEVTVLTLRQKRNRPAAKPAGRELGERHAAASGRYLPASRLCLLL
jgi:hypothetical protein